MVHMATVGAPRVLPSCVSHTRTVRSTVQLLGVDFTSTARVFYRQPNTIVRIPTRSGEDRRVIGEALKRDIVTTGRSQNFSGGIVHYFAALATDADRSEEAARDIWDVLSPVLGSRELFQTERDGLAFIMYRPMIDICFGGPILGGLAAAFLGLDFERGLALGALLLFAQNYLAYRKSRRVAQESPREGFNALIGVNDELLMRVARGQHGHWTGDLSTRVMINRDHPLASHIRALSRKSKQRPIFVPPERIF